jgi:hypothetical protein
MDLDRKQRVLRRWAAALAKTMFDTNIYENTIA